MPSNWRHCWGVLLVLGLLQVPVASTAPAASAPPIYMRFRVLDTKERHESQNQSLWVLPNHTATDVLAMIADFKPTVLERFFSGRQNLSASVPVSSGSPPMTVREFLIAAQAAGSGGNCAIMPRVSLYEALEPTPTILQTTAQLRALPIPNKLTVLGLDNWANYASDPSVNKTAIVTLLTALHAQGWERLSINTVGGLHGGAYGLASMADFGTVTSATPPGAVGAVPNWEGLAHLNADPSIVDKLLYIDFPAQIQSFMNGSSPDQMAAAIVDSLANNTQQGERGYSFVYPIAQAFFDATALRTADGGRFGGKSLYRVMCENMRAAVEGRPPADLPGCKLY